MLAEVAQVEKAMTELLAMIADSQPDSLAAAWKRCDEAQAELDLFLKDTSGLQDDQKAELRTGLENLVRLNAITRQAVCHNQDGLAQGLARTKQESAKVKAYSSAATGLGGSCDLAG